MAPPRIDELVPPGRHVELPGRGTTYVHEAGVRTPAPTLVLLHGWGATAALNWFTAFPALSRRYHVLAMDLRGHGRGIRSRRPFRLEACADDVVALLDVLGIEKAVPVGYSLGGPVAQLTWRRHAERTTGLVLCATARNFGGSGEARLAFSALPAVALATRLVPPLVRRSIVNAVFNARVDDPAARRWVMGEARRHDPAAVAEAGSAIGSFNSREWIGEVDVPAAVVLTLQDGLVPPARQLKLARALRDVTVHPVDADHGACVARPDLFVPALLEACASVADRAAVSSAAERRAPHSTGGMGGGADKAGLEAHALAVSPAAERRAPHSKRAHGWVG